MIRLLYILTAILAFSAVAKAGPDRPQHNFLFIIDSSFSMSARKPAALKLVQDIITSGFNGQVEPGDSVDIWTYDTENNLRGFPPQIWQGTNAQLMARTAADYLQKYQFKGRSQFANVATDLNILVPETKNLLTVIITDGEEPFSGISLDLIINEYLAKKGKLGTPSNQPLLISLAAINGSFRTWTAFFGEGQLQLAHLPERAKPAPAASVASAEVNKQPAARPKAELRPPEHGRQTQHVATRPLPQATRITPGPGEDEDEVNPLERPLELPLNEQLKHFKWPVQSKLSAPPSAKTAHLSKPPANQRPAPNVVAASPAPVKIAEPQATNSLALVPAPAPVQPTNVPIVVASTTAPAPPGTPPPAPNLPLNPEVKTAAKTSSSAKAFREPATLHRAIYISGFIGAGCILVGIYLLIRKFTRPTQSIISRSLLQR